jgi:ATP-dependent Clp protease ATP-binding subunit ClpA
MFDRFSDDAKRALSRSRQEAMRLHQDFIGVEHILLGLLRTPDEGVATIVRRAGGDAAKAVQALDAVIAPGHVSSMGQFPFTPEAKHALVLTMEAATEFGHNVIDTAHLLLGAADAAAGKVEAALVSGGIHFADLQRECAAAARGEAEPDSAPLPPRHVRVPVFDLGAAVATIAELELRLDAFAAAAEQTGAAKVLSELLDRCVQARTALRAPS